MVTHIPLPPPTTVIYNIDHNANGYYCINVTFLKQLENNHSDHSSSHMDMSGSHINNVLYKTKRCPFDIVPNYQITNEFEAFVKQLPSP